MSEIKRLAAIVQHCDNCNVTYATNLGDPLECPVCTDRRDVMPRDASTEERAALVAALNAAQPDVGDLEALAEQVYREKGIDYPWEQMTAADKWKYRNEACKRIAGDVEALARQVAKVHSAAWSASLLRTNTTEHCDADAARAVAEMFVARESTLRAERDAAAAEAATLREILRMNLQDFGLVNVAIEANPSLSLHPFTQAVKQTEAALATPASPATARHAALEEIAETAQIALKYLDRDILRGREPVVKFAIHELFRTTDALRALDGGDA